MGVELVVNKGMSNKTITIRRPVQHLIPPEMSRDLKNENLAEQQLLM